MSILSQVETGKKIGPPRAVIYSEPKAGKTTLIASIPGIVVIPLEEGQGTLDYPRTPQPTDYATFIDTLRELAQGGHGFKAVGIDGLTGVEELIWRKVCDESMGGDWEKFHAYGRGPRQASALWVDVCRELDAVRRKGIAIWCAAHSKLETVEDVSVGSYARMTPSIDKHALGVVTKWSDLIGYIDLERMASTKGAKDAQKKTNTARTTGVRQLIVEDTGSHMAGNRYGLGSPIELPVDNPYGPLRAALIAAVTPKQTATEEAA
jgi:hypothetical protein